MSAALELSLLHRQLVLEIDQRYRQIERCQKDLERFAAGMKRFEEIYQMSSQEFYTRFEKGELSDNMDFFEWASLCDMFQHALEDLKRMEEDLHDILSQHLHQ